MIAAATVHFPYATGMPDAAPEADRAATYAGFAALGQAFADHGVEAVVAFTSEHVVSLQPRLAPPFTIGIGATHEAFPEPHFNLDPVARPGDPVLARRLLRALDAAGVDAAHSVALPLDHGTLLPLQLMRLPTGVRLVPIVINSVFPPLPSLGRCRALGAAVGAFLREAGLARRVGLLATGGVSHTVGAPGVDRNDPAFDAKFLAAIEAADLDTLAAIPDAALDAGGNGTHEVRNWVALAAALAPLRPRIVTRLPFVPGWNTGVFQALWDAREAA